LNLFGKETSATLQFFIHPPFSHTPGMV